MNRAAQLKNLTKNPFDILVIGGGATGAGIALDATSRGLKTALVERDDFASGTSSRSTKLIHGGVRYLERAVWGLDRGQYALVKEALHERSILLRLAPHLTRYIPLLTPLYHRVEVPYYFAGLKMYDWLANDNQAPPSRYVSSKEALKLCPILKTVGLRGGVVYYDGQFDDARMGLSILLRANELGAVTANHIEVKSLLKTQGKLTGARLTDTLSGERFSATARVVINATGPLADRVRHMDDPAQKPLLKASSGVHIVLDRSFSAPEMGLLIPKTEDDRVLFALPWLGHTLVGTTDNPAEPEWDPSAQEADVAYILRQLSQYIERPVRSKDILSQWCGLRPLIRDEGVSTSRLSREHMVEVSPSGLVTIAGGKWTTYRRMAMDAVDEAIRVGGLVPPHPCQTHQIFLAGGANYSSEDAHWIHEQTGWEFSVCKYLNRAYGDRARQVVDLATKTGKHFLVPPHPYLEAEVVYGARFEGACTSMDILARRLRLAFLDQKAAAKASPRVHELLAEELQWDERARQRDKELTKAYFQHHFRK